MDFSHIPPQTAEENPLSYEVISLKTRIVWQVLLLTAPHCTTGTWELYNTEEKELQSWWLVRTISDLLKASSIATQKISSLMNACTIQYCSKLILTGTKVSTHLFCPVVHTQITHLWLNVAVSC